MSETSSGDDRVGRIRERLQRALSPESLEILDQSVQHAGHEGARGGGGHYVVRVVSEAFAGKAPLARHRMVYTAVGEMMQHEIHALSIQALTPGET